MNQEDRIVIKDDKMLIPHVFIDGVELDKENSINTLQTLLLGISDEAGKEIIENAIKYLRRSMN